MTQVLTGRRAIITGGSRGIGRAIAEAFLDNGASVGLIAKDPTRLRKTAEALAEHGGKVAWHAADTRDDTALTAAIRGLREKLGGVDILVNSAAVPNSPDQTEGPLVDYDESRILDEFQTKILGYLRAAVLVAPALKAQGWGRIISIGGQAVRTTGSVAGSVRNAAVTALTVNIADELGPHGVTSNVINPGWTSTEGNLEWIDRTADPDEALAGIAASTSTGRLPGARDVAEIAVFLASEAAWPINGESLNINRPQGIIAGY